MKPSRRENTGLVDPANFVEAMRDAGYRSPATALAELVDNSLEAGATTVCIDAALPAGSAGQVEIRDDGVGMTRGEISRALRFGGSSRFGSRASLGRFGMGLPTASLSLARHVEIESWRGNTIHRTELSIDSAAAGVGLVKTRRRTSSDTRTASGTIVTLRDCDRIGYSAQGWLVRHLRSAFSTMYRSALAGSFSLVVDGSRVRPLDHLLLDQGATRFGDDLKVAVGSSDPRDAVSVRFSELPVRRWARLGDAEKRRLGVLRREPVSVTRAGREIDRGWFFMGDKPRENYDSWWRCEIDFGPSLDEQFGVTFTKQRVRPTARLSELLSVELEPIARALNSRARHSFEMLKLEEPRLELERAVNTVLRDLSQGRWLEDVSIDFRRLANARCLETSIEQTGRRISLNTDHAAFKSLYRPLAEVESSDGRRLARMILGAIVSTEITDMVERDSASVDWDDVLTALLAQASK